MGKAASKNRKVTTIEPATKRKAIKLPVEAIAPILRFLPTSDFVGLIGNPNILPRWEAAANLELKERLPFSVKLSHGIPYEYGCTVFDRHGQVIINFERAQDFLKSSIYELVEELCIPLYIYTDKRDVDWKILEEVYLGLPGLNSLVIEPRSREDFDPQSKKCPRRKTYGGRGDKLEIPLADAFLNCEEFVVKFSRLLPRLKSFKLTKSEPELGYEVRLLRIVALIRQTKKLETLDITIKRFGYVVAEKIPKSEIYALPAIEMDCLKSLQKLALLKMEPLPGGFMGGCVHCYRPGDPDLPTVEMLQFIASHCTDLRDLAMVFSAPFYDRKHRDMAHYFAAFRLLAKLRKLHLKVANAHQWTVKQDEVIVPQVTDLRIDLDAHISDSQAVIIASKFSGITSFVLQPYVERVVGFAMLRLWDMLSRLADLQILPRLTNLKVISGQEVPAYHHADFTVSEISFFAQKLSISGTFDLSQFHFCVFFYDREMLTDLYRSMQSNEITCLKLRGLVTQHALSGFRDFLADSGGCQSFKWISGESSRKSAPSEFVWAPEFYDCVTNFKFSGTKTVAGAAADDASFTVEIHS